MEGPFLKDWKPTEDVVIVIDDKTGSHRTQEQLDGMMNAFQDVANEYGFDLHMWGMRESFRKLMSRNMF